MAGRAERAPRAVGTPLQCPTLIFRSCSVPCSPIRCRLKTLKPQFSHDTGQSCSQNNRQGRRSLEDKSDKALATAEERTICLEAKTDLAAIRRFSMRPASLNRAQVPGFLPWQPRRIFLMTNEKKNEAPGSRRRVIRSHHCPVRPWTVFPNRPTALTPRSGSMAHLVA